MSHSTYKEHNEASEIYTVAMRVMKSKGYQAFTPEGDILTLEIIIRAILESLAPEQRALILERIKQ
jgi:hypothetical protein